MLYWMTAFRRLQDNFALERAVEVAIAFGRPLVILEGLRCDYRWASDRLHRFVLDGMVDNAQHAARTAATYLPYAERRPGEGAGLLATLARDACLVVADDAPVFFLPHMLERAAGELEKLGTALEAVDSNGLLPLRAAPRVFRRAVDFRRHLQRTLGEHLLELPQRDPLARLPPARPVALRSCSAWSMFSAAERRRPQSLLATLPIDHSVPACPEQPGGSTAALERLRRFVDERLDRYVAARLDLDAPATSGLSAYLHFGHLASHRVLGALTEKEDWSPASLSQLPARGARAGWWGMSENAEAFLDQLVTWRELGYNMAWQHDDVTSYASLPEWARASLERHRSDPRPQTYTRRQLEEARTHDPIWNAAQRQLLCEGRIHNYLRMLWGKKVLEWTRTPRHALEVLIELNDRYAIDGRDPSSYSGIGWCFGRYDRPWPERPIFGTVRAMSSASARRKLRMTRYLERHGGGAQLGLGL